MKQVKVKLTCARCSINHSINVDLADLQMWQSGASFIEDAIPYISQEDREFFMSGLCSACYPRTDYEPELADEYEEWLDRTEFGELDKAIALMAESGAQPIKFDQPALSSDGELYGIVDEPDYSIEWMITFNHLDNKYLLPSAPPYIVKFEIFGPNNVKHFTGWMTVFLSNTTGIHAPLDHCRAYHGSTHMVINGEVFNG